MIDSTADALIPIKAVSRLVRSPSPPHLSTVVRWAIQGVGRPPVRLETVVVGGRRYTTAAALEAFVRATTGYTAGMAGLASRARRAAVCRAEVELDADGIN